ncbi:hypothetical protein BDR07DRAFT_1605387 [Suillus spraguei]|nr:hypothetical protein BDR07DRAFT_1605387 [Suillus spraguei]
MTIVSNDLAWWPTIHAGRVLSYFAVASFVGVTYDWILTFGQEVELIWRQRWSLMTIMYLGIRYLGISYAVLDMLTSVTTISLTDRVSYVLYAIWECIVAVVIAMLWVIIITRLHAMYQRSRKILIFLIAISSAVIIFNGVTAILSTTHASGEEFILSGAYQCFFSPAENIVHLYAIGWILLTVWEVFAMYLAVWIAVKRFRELRRHSAGGIIGDCFTVLMKTHLPYFASFVVASCFQLITIFTPTTNEYSQNYLICAGLFNFVEVMQMSVLGPRLILSVREYHAKLVVDSDAASGMSSIAFQERVHISTGSSV